MRIQKSIILMLIFGLVPAAAYADRDLVSVANSAVSQGTLIAKAICALGALVGAIAYQIPGAAQWARTTLVAGLFGLGITYGIPSLLSLVRMVFGGA